MSKKTILLALLVASVFTIPSGASAQEIHLSGITTFTGTSAASTFSAVNEPKISCTTFTLSGSFDAGSTTTGKATTTRTGCTAEFLGIKGNCNTAGDSSGVITSSTTFHLITTSTGKPGILMTPATVTTTCVGFARTELTGKGLIGTITSPACGSKSKTIGLSFEAEGSTQKHLEYTGVKYDLSADTENSAGETTSSGTAAFSGATTLSSSTEGTLECT